MTQIVLPGDFLPSLLPSTSCKIGNGVTKKKNGDLVAVQPGILHVTAKNVFVEVYSKRYIPQEGDKIIGVVTSKGGDMFKVDIGAADLAQLNYMAFEGATKRNRPNVKTGDLVYGVIQLSCKHMEPEISCVEKDDLRAHSMGVLPQGGFVFKISLNLARRLLGNNSVLTLLGNTLKFESTVGLNGRVWIKANSTDQTLFIRDVILESERVYESQIQTFVNQKVRDTHEIFIQVQPEPNQVAAMEENH